MTLAIVLATVVVVLVGNTEAGSPIHTRTGHLHIGIVVDETEQGIQCP